MDGSYLLNQIFGAVRPEVYLGGFFFTLVAVLFMKHFETKKKIDVTDRRTPNSWSFWFMVADNIKDILQVLTLTFIGFRFSNFLVTKYLSIFDKDLDLMLYAVLIGFLSNYILSFLQKLQKRWGQQIVEKSEQLDAFKE